VAELERRRRKVRPARESGQSGERAAGVLVVRQNLEGRIQDRRSDHASKELCRICSRW